MIIFACRTISDNVFGFLSSVHQFWSNFQGIMYGYQNLFIKKKLYNNVRIISDRCLKVSAQSQLFCEKWGDGGGSQSTKQAHCINFSLKIKCSLS